MFKFVTKFVAKFLCVFFCSWLMVACTPTVTTWQNEANTLDFNTTPDIVILTISGHCGPPCRAPRDNWDYLSQRGTVQKLTQTFTEAGYTVQNSNYAAHPSNVFTSPYHSQIQRGYLSLLKDFAEIEKHWMNSPKPPRIILLGHSHGSVWLHYFVQTHPQSKFALQIDIDSICTAWRSDFSKAVAEFHYNDLASPLNACDSVKIADKDVYLKDIVWPNVEYNLEIQSKRLPSINTNRDGVLINYLYETTPNVRPDGTLTGIETFVATNEDHSTSTNPQSSSIRWITAQIKGFIKDWQAEDNAIK